jgi:hypothetical protein
VPIPWLRLLDAALGLRDLARRVRQPPESGGQPGVAGGLEQFSAAPGGALETRLAGVVVAALKEAFDRDHQRMQLEREQIEAERQRAERALRLEVARQAADREIGRLRLLSGVALASWLGTLFFSPRVIEGAVAGRVALGLGWLLLLGALAAAFGAQSAVARMVSQLDDRTSGQPITSGTAGAAAPWLMVAGLAAVAMAVLIG